MEFSPLGKASLSESKDGLSQKMTIFRVDSSGTVDSNSFEFHKSIHKLSHTIDRDIFEPCFGPHLAKGWAEASPIVVQPPLAKQLLIFYSSSCPLPLWNLYFVVFDDFYLAINIFYIMSHFHHTLTL